VFDANVTVIDCNGVNLSLASDTTLVLNDATDDISVLYDSILLSG
jgi:hypothetical protein